MRRPSLQRLPLEDGVLGSKRGCPAGGVLSVPGNRHARALTLVAVTGETRTVRVQTIAFAVTIAASGCTSHAPSAAVSYERRVRCTQDQVKCLDDCMPNPEWAVIPVLGWVYVPGREYLCQSHCDCAQEACLAPSLSAIEAADDPNTVKPPAIRAITSNESGGFYAKKTHVTQLKSVRNADVGECDVVCGAGVLQEPSGRGSRRG